MTPLEKTIQDLKARGQQPYGFTGDLDPLHLSGMTVAMEVAEQIGILTERETWGFRDLYAVLAEHCIQVRTGLFPYCRLIILPSDPPGDRMVFATLGGRQVHAEELSVEEYHQRFVRDSEASGAVRALCLVCQMPATGVIEGIYFIQGYPYEIGFYQIPDDPCRTCAAREEAVTS